MSVVYRAMEFSPDLKTELAITPLSSVTCTQGHVLSFPSAPHLPQVVRLSGELGVHTLHGQELLRGRRGTERWKEGENIFAFLWPPGEVFPLSLILAFMA